MNGTLRIQLLRKRQKSNMDLILRTILAPIIQNSRLVLPLLAQAGPIITNPI